MSRPQLQELVIAADPRAWERAGFVVASGACRIGSTTLRFAPGTPGIVSMALEGVPAGAIDGLAVHAAGGAADAAVHPLGARAIDHVVIFTPDADRTSGALGAAGLDLRRMEDVAGERPLRRGFVLAAEALLEVVGPAVPGGDEPVRFWGLTVVVDDLDAAVLTLGERCGTPRAAVQPGRRIATLREDADLGLPVALITPRG